MKKAKKAKKKGKKKEKLSIKDIIELIIRALAKLSGAIKIADTRNQGEAESEAFSAIAVTF